MAYINEKKIKKNIRKSSQKLSNVKFFVTI